MTFKFVKIRVHIRIFMCYDINHAQNDITQTKDNITICTTL